MNVIVLPAVGLLLASAAVSRYGADPRALAAGLVTACAGTLGAALSLPDISLNIPLWLLLALGGMATVVAAAASIYSEVRLRTLAPEQSVHGGTAGFPQRADG